MKFQAEIGDEKHDLEIKRNGRELRASVDGREYQLEVSEPEPGVFLFKHEGKVYEAAVSKSGGREGRTLVRVGGREFDIRIIDLKRLRSVADGTDHRDGVAEIKTAMPGKVVRVLVEPGAEVQKGAGVLVVEAMKMQNELKSPKTGTVRELRVKEGATVGPGEVLATIE